MLMQVYPSCTTIFKFIEIPKSQLSSRNLNILSQVVCLQCLLDINLDTTIQIMYITKRLLNPVYLI